MLNIVKDFPGVRALDGVTLSVGRGQILGLCGENGAGKSTLMKILSGVYPAGDYEGDIYIEGALKQFTGTNDAERSGVAIIHQELNLFPELSLSENIFIGHEIADRGWIDWAQCHSEAEKLFRQYDLDLDPEKLVKDIKLGQAQLLEITKALSRNARILVLDEPTSALSEQETAKLFRIMRQLKQDGVTMFFISHKLDEVKEICDEVVALRDGKNVGVAVPVSQMTKDEIVRAMVGRDIKTLYPKVDVKPGKPILEIKNLYVDHPLLIGEHVVKNITFSVREGEIFGIYGLMGSGRTELLTSVFAGFPVGDFSGEVSIDGEPKKLRSTADAIESGMGLVTEDRKLFGLVLEQTIRENISLASLGRLSHRGVMDELEERKGCDQQIGNLRIKTPSREQMARNLSGGNQQKVVLAKWLSTQPKILMLDEPTRGVDIGAKSEIYQIMNQLKEQGVAMVMVTSDLPELMGMSDRIMVMREGENVGTFDRKDVTVERLGALATGNV